MKSNVLSRERVFSMLRAQGIEHLGELRRVYLEASGDLSLFRRKEPRPGLSILPTFDDKLRRDELSPEGAFACFSCGHMIETENEPSSACEHCGVRYWTPAVNTSDHLSAN